MRNFIVGAATALFVLTSAGTASARPGEPEEPYYGPAYGTASQFAGHSASGCANIKSDVFKLKPKACGGSN